MIRVKSTGPIKVDGDCGDVKKRLIFAISLAHFLFV